jgi:hypothetical protein
MASTYSTNLALELIGTGDQAGTWGNTTNTNLGTLIEQAVSGYVTQAVATGTDTTITIPNGATGVARNMFIELTGTGGTNTNLIVPANKKLYFIYNNASGAVTVKVAGQTGVSVAVGAKVILVSNGTDVVEATTYLTAVPSSLSVTTLSASSANITTLSGTSASYTNGSFTSANITTVTGTSATFTTSSDGVGNLRNIPSAGSAKTSSYTLTTSDIGEFVTVGTGGAITVPNDTFAAGNAVSIYNDTTGNVTITCSITTAYIAGTNTDKATMTLATRGLATFLFVNPSLCVASGNLT